MPRPVFFGVGAPGSPPWNGGGRAARSPVTHTYQQARSHPGQAPSDGRTDQTSRCPPGHRLEGSGWVRRMGGLAARPTSPTR
eukprot:10274009-Alexandrium_andersonii.AAC.1